MTTSTPPAITIRPVRADEIDTYFDLTLLVDLHVPAHLLATGRAARLPATSPVRQPLPEQRRPGHRPPAR
ncbi:hypothetical protein SAMN05216532_8135 [Streptomyces sp. 2231.1]|uniref:hypothetical protein n=1 Tax=Streptomyces sp. 2231.1 TaxID=1855347 RepID=UPI00089C4F67|nr:hypothetical protein [Streptomyces sp. 2231.1]SEE40867.1 hypothetical protein SAMN05216532_8135 [Streptomyces sp. 2231.1]